MTGLLQLITGVGAVYIDIAKAFDSVSHVKLLNKLQAHGICGQLLNWIESFFD